MAPYEKGRKYIARGPKFVITIPQVSI